MRISAILCLSIMGYVSNAWSQPIPIANVQRTEAVDFEKDILPIFQRNCLACHSTSEQQGNLVLESPDAIREGRDAHPAVIPGRGADSLLVKLSAHQQEPLMPPAGNDVNAKPLTPEELGLLRLWIDQGARGSGGVATLSPKQWQAMPRSVGPVYAVAVSLDGQYAAASRGSQLFIYHIPTGRRITSLSDPSPVSTAETVAEPTTASRQAHRDLIQSLALSAEGDLLASGSFREVKLWRRPRDVQITSLATGTPVNALAVSPDGKQIATSGGDHHLQLWDVATGAPGLKWLAHTDQITALRYTRDGKMLISSSLDQSIRFWNPADGTSTGVIESPAAVSTIQLVSSADPSEQQPDPSQLLVSGGADPLIRTWALPQRPPIKLELALDQLDRFATNNNGELLAMSSSDGTLRVLSRRRPAPDQPFTVQTVAQWKPGVEVTGLAFVEASLPEDPPAADSPAATLATIDADGAISLWSLPDHQLIDRWRGGTTAASAVASSADGKLLASGTADGSISLWNLSPVGSTRFDGSLENSATVFAMNTRRTLYAVAGTAAGKPVVLVRNLESGQTTHTLLGHDAVIRSIAFSRDAAKLVTGADDKTARVWNLNDTPQPEALKLEGTAAVTAVAFSSDGGQVLGGGADHSLRLWNLSDAQPVKEFVGHSAAVIGVGFTLSNQPFSVSADKSVRFWNAADAAQVRTFTAPATPLSMAVRPDGQRLALAGDDNQVHIYQLDNGQLLQTLAGHAQPPVTLSFSADSKRLVSTSNSANEGASEAIIWDVEPPTARLLESFTKQAMTAAAFTSQSDRISLQDSAGGLEVRNLRFLRHLNGNQQGITSLRFLSNGQTLYATAKDGSLRGYSATSGQQTFAAAHGAAISALAMSPNEQVLATAGENATVRLWQPNGAAFSTQQLGGLPGPASAAAFSADDSQVLVACAGEDPQIIIFDLKTATPQQRFSSHSQPVVGVTILPGDLPETSQVLSSSAESLWQWEISAAGQLSGHSAAVTSLAVFPAAPMQVFSGSRDGTIRRWDLQNGRQLAQFNHGGPVLGIDVRIDGQRFASASENRTARLWNINGQMIAEMRGDIRRKTQLARLTQQTSAAEQRVNVATQRLDAAEKDVPLKTEAERKAVETLTVANKDVEDKTTAMKAAEVEKIAAEKAAIQAAAAARERVLLRTKAEEAAAAATADVASAQQQATRLAAASAAAASDETIKNLATEAQAAVASTQQKAQQLQEAVSAPTQAALEAVTAANQAAEKVMLVQKPFNDARTAVKMAEAAQNLASQQHVLAVRELEIAKAAVPETQQALAERQAALESLKAMLEEARVAVGEAEMPLRLIRFSPDGTALATAGDFPTIHLWDAETGAAMSSLAGHSGPIADICFVDNRHIVSASPDQAVHRWDLNPSWRLERTIGSVDQSDLITHRVMSLDFSADASQLLVGSGVPSRSGELHVFNAADGTRTLYLPQAHDDVVHSARFSPDGKRIASAGADKYLRTWELASGQMLRRFEGHSNYVLGLAWKGDGQTIVTAAADDSIKVWNSETGDQIRTITNFGKHVTGVRYIGESENIVSSCGDKTVRMHNAANGGNFRNFSAAAWLHAVDVTPDGNVVAAGAADGSLMLWNGNNGQPIRTIEVGNED